MHFSKAVRIRGAVRAVPWLGAIAFSLFASSAHALPAFARQTGQNCLACHAGGQFPELTPYGRLFKMTGYTIGKRNIPLALMAYLGYSKVSNTSKDPDPEQQFAKNGAPVFSGASLFIAGKITDNMGAFTQITYDNYAQQSTTPSGDPGYWQGHTSADNMDFRYADHFVSPGNDLIFGVSLNNNPSVSDPWNTAAAWMQYVPAPSAGSSQFTDANAPYPGQGTDQAAGLTAYMYWNKMIYGELGFYRTANGAFSFMTAGTPDDGTTHLNGTNPYWRLAFTREWGPSNLMVGTSGMVAHVYDGNSYPGDPNAYNKVKTVGIDAQYQYLLSPSTATVQAAYQHQVTDNSPNAVAGGSNASDTVNVFRLKGSYIYDAKYGGSIAYFNQTGTTDAANVDLTPTTGNASGSPATSGETLEAFWIPIQYVRVGLQYTMYNKFNGASSNYDGNGRNASDNNTLFLYVWAAY